MADEVDQANDHVEMETALRVAAAAREPEKGHPGECYLCGEHSIRLVRGACARCRDKHRLP